MDLSLLRRVDEHRWEIPMHGAMRVPAVIYASEALMRDMDHKVYEQAVNVAMLPGIVGASYAMPDAHWGYGFPIGGVAAFDPEQGGVVSAGGVGFDISCGVRCLHTGLTRRGHHESPEGARARALAQHPGGSRQHRRDPPRRGRDGRDARRRRALGGRARLGRARGPRAHRGAGADEARQARQRCRSRQRSASATRWARSAAATTTWRCRRSRRCSMRRSPPRSVSRRATSW